MENERWIAPMLHQLRAEGRGRTLQTLSRAGGRCVIDGRHYLNFSSNDYLDLAGNPSVLSRAAETLRRHGAGAGASRLVTGTLPCHVELEEALAAWHSREAALVFGSGCLANLGLIASVVNRKDVVFADKLVHATILDGILLSRARLYRFPHNDVDQLDRLMTRAAAARGAGARFLVATESVFSMDGDRAPLQQIAQIARRHEAMLLVDEAHALGVFGPQGAGRVPELELVDHVNACTATLSKALGSYGGFVTCSRELRALVINRARTFIFSTGLPPASVGAAHAALEIIRAASHLGRTLLERADRFRRQLHAQGLNVMQSTSQIIPLLTGDNSKALRLSARLKTEGVLAMAIREPTVPRGSARIRLSVTLAHSDDDLRRTAEVLVECARREALL